MVRINSDDDAGGAREALPATLVGSMGVCSEGPVLRGEVLYTEQDSLTGGLSREGSVCERRTPHGEGATLPATLREDWVGCGALPGPASHPLHDAGGEEEALAEEEYEGVYHGQGSSDEFSDVEETGRGADTEVVYVKEGVTVCPTASRRQRISGRLSLISQYKCLFLCWLPYAAAGTGEAQQLKESGGGGSNGGRPPDDGAAGNGSGGGGGGGGGSGAAASGTAGNGAAAAAAAAAGPAAADCAKDRSMYAVHPIPLSDMKAIRKHTPTLGQHHVTITLGSGVSLPSFFFQKGGVKSFLSCLRQHACLVRSADDPNTYLVNDTADPLQRSLCSLELRDVTVGRLPVGASLALTSMAGTGRTSMAGPLAGGHWAAGEEDVGLRAQLGELVDRFQQLTQSARDTASSYLAGSMLMGVAAAPPPAPPYHGGAASMFSAGTARHAAAAGGAGKGLAGGRPLVVVRRMNSLEEAPTGLGTFELVEGSEDWEGGGGGGGGNGRGGWRERPRPPPLTLAELGTFYDSEGRLANPSAFQQRVHDGGAEPEARPEAWKLLLGVTLPGWTAKQRAQEEEERRARYRRIKLQWSSVDREQAARCSKWRERRTRIEKDVRRTDRAHRFYARERSQAHEMLANILKSYERFNQDLGYVQGMSDLLAPILYVMRCGAPGGPTEALTGEQAVGVEAEAFWTFERLMRRMEPNFSSDSRGMQAQLLALRGLVQLLDPQLYAHLEARDCLNFFFCYRWILIHFKREFAFDEVMRLWEALWAGAPGLHLYLCAAVLMQHRRVILSSDWSFDEMLQWSVGISGKLRLEQLLRDAERLVAAAGGAGREIVAGLDEGGG